MRALAVITALALAGGAFALGRVTAPDVTSTATRERVIDRMVAVPAGGACVARLGDDDLRRLRDEIVAALPASGPARATDETAPPTPAQATAADATDRLLDRALAAGRWTDDDAAALRTELAAMDPAQMTAALQRMAALVNAGRLRVETTGSPF